MVFPSEPRSWPDLDDWFWLNRRLVLGCILAANLAWGPIALSSPDIHLGATEATMVLLYFATLILAIFASKRWLVTAALAFLIVQNLALGAVDFISRLSVR